MYGEDAVPLSPRSGRTSPAIAYTQAAYEQASQEIYGNRGEALGAVGLVSMWLAAGTLFYHFYCEWTLPESFYYAVQAGLSIGFGVLQEPDDISKAFTVLHVLIGTGAIAGALGVVAQLAVEKAKRLDDSPAEGQDLPGTHEPHQRHSLCHVIWLTITHTEVMVLIAWLAIGVLYGVFHEGWSVISSLYYSVTAMSTAGLQSPTRQPSSLLFTALYSLSGVPIYGMALAELASIIIQRFNERRRLRQESLSRKVDTQQWQQTPPMDADAQIWHVPQDWADFLAQDLLQRGLITPSDLAESQRRFEQLSSQGIRRRKVERIPRALRRLQ